MFEFLEDSVGSALATRGERKRDRKKVSAEQNPGS
jgi:hypothetical protein